MNNKVSIVVTCYNHEDYIEQCLRSIFCQTYKNIELLVFNDGSTDNSEQIIKETLRETPFIETTYYFSENQGVSKTRNKALEKITGEFLLYVDSDNFLDDDYIEILLQNLVNNKADIAYCQLWDFLNKRVVLREDLEFSLESELKGNLIDVSSLVRISAIKGVTFDTSLKTLEDYDFWLQAILKNCAKPIFVSNVKLNYRIVEGSRNERGNWDKYYQSYFYILNKYNKKYPELVMKALQSNIFIWLNGALDSNKALDEKEQEVQKLKNRLTSMENKNAQLVSENMRLAVENKGIMNSTSFKVGKIITFPARKAKAFINLLNRNKE